MLLAGSLHSGSCPTEHPNYCCDFFCILQYYMARPTTLLCKRRAAAQLHPAIGWAGTRHAEQAGSMAGPIFCHRAPYFQCCTACKHLCQFGDSQFRWVPPTFLLKQGALRSPTQLPPSLLAKPFFQGVVGKQGSLWAFTCTSTWVYASRAAHSQRFTACSCPPGRQRKGGV